MPAPTENTSISNLPNGGSVQAGDDVPASRAGSTVRIQFGTAASQNSSAFEPAGGGAWTEADAGGTVDLAAGSKTFISPFDANTVFTLPSAPPSGTRVQLLLENCNGSAVASPSEGFYLVGDQTASISSIRPAAGNQMLVFEYANASWALSIFGFTTNLNSLDDPDFSVVRGVTAGATSFGLQIRNADGDPYVDDDGVLTWRTDQLVFKRIAGDTVIPLGPSGGFVPTTEVEGETDEVLSGGGPGELPVWVKKSSISGGTAIARTAWVETAGDDDNGEVGNIAAPFATLNAALTALGTSTSTTKILRVGVGRFAPVTNTIYPNTRILGSGKPIVKSDYTTLFDDSGTIIDGPLLIPGVSNIEVGNLGVDSGSAVCTARYSGVGKDGLGVYSPSTPSTGWFIHDITAIAQSRTALFHATLFENGNKCHITNITTYFGVHGVALKLQNSTVSNLSCDSHEYDGVIIKADSANDCFNLAVSNVVITSVASAGGGGIFFDAGQTSAPDLTDIVVTNVFVKGCSYGRKWEGGGTGTIRRISLSNYAEDTVTTSVIKTGNVESHTCFTNGVSFKTAPTFAGSWVNFGSGNSLAAWWLEQNGQVLALSGVIKSGSGVIFTIDPSAVPIDDTKWLSAFGFNSVIIPLAVTLAENGEVSLSLGDIGAGFMSLDGLRTGVPT